MDLELINNIEIINSINDSNLISNKDDINFSSYAKDNIDLVI